MGGRFEIVSGGMGRGEPTILLDEEDGVLDAGAEEAILLLVVAAVMDASHLEAETNRNE